MEALASSVNVFFQQVSDSATPPMPDNLPVEFVIDWASVELKLS